MLVFEAYPTILHQQGHEENIN